MNQKDFNDKLAAEAKKRRKHLLNEFNKGRSAQNLATHYGISKARIYDLLKRAREE